MDRRTDIVDAPHVDYAASVMVFPSNVDEGRVFLAVNEREGSDDSTAAYLTPRAAEDLALALVRQAAYVRERTGQ